jgi:23S rRNA pseudouridine2457 synthase
MAISSIFRVIFLLYGKTVRMGEMGERITVAFYKPDGVMTAFTDPEGRETLKAYVDLPDIYPAGRLDLDSEGLLLLTSDGRLAHRLTDPAFQHPKTYLVQVEGIPDAQALARLESGVEVKGRLTRRAQVVVAPGTDLPPRRKPVTPHGPTTWLRIVLREGKKRQVRHMTAAVGLPTLRLVRVAIGPIGIGDLQPGEWRYLSPAEEEALRRLAAAPAARKRAANKRAAKRPEPTAGEKPGASRDSSRGSRYRSAGRRPPAR